MQRFNFLAPSFEMDPEDPPGYRAGAVRIGPVVGGDALGASMYRLPPGESVCPYHYEIGEEEWLFVIKGDPVVRTPAGDETLAPGDVVCFREGPDGAHKVTGGTEEAQIIIVSSVTTPAVAVYPDSDKIGVFTKFGADRRHLFRRSADVDYYDGET